MGSSTAASVTPPDPAVPAVTVADRISASVLVRMSLNAIAPEPATETLTSPEPDTAIATPIDAESWNYSLGHWVEDDPVVGDHAFSSAGALGFYPWIDRTKTLYGILSRRSDGLEGNAGYNSARCGRLIRQAWVTGVAVTSGAPTPSP